LCSIRTLLKAFSSLVVVKNADASFIKSRSWQRFGWSCGWTMQFRFRY
jgi:hypothetical protein